VQVARRSRLAPVSAAAPGTSDTAAAAPAAQEQPAAAAAPQPPPAAASQASSSSSSGTDNSGYLAGIADAPPLSPKTEAQLSQAQYIEIYDRLIKIFQERPREDWKRLIVFSRQWPQHKQGVFDRCVCVCC
jgi:hypothetical protein